jgi:hypothetical protein
MSHHQYRADQIRDLVNAYAQRTGLSGETTETKVSDMIADLLHFAAAERPREPHIALDAARKGIMHFVSNHNVSLENHLQGDIGPEALVSIKVSCETDIWSSCTGIPASIEHLGEDLGLEIA